MVKNHLDGLGLAYHEVQVAGNPAGLREMIPLSGSRKAPVTLIDGQVVVGPDPAALDGSTNRSDADRDGSKRHD
ncbi:MAG: glutaredoxin family protein [Thermodesulfobacteriota bacterium]